MVNACNEPVWLFLRRRQRFGKVVERYMYPPPAPPERIDHLMPCDRPNPWGCRGHPVPALSLEVNGEQRLLHDILGIGIGEPRPREALAGEGANHRGQLQQKTAV